MSSRDVNFPSFELPPCSSKNNLHLKPDFSCDTPLYTRVKKKRAFDRDERDGKSEGKSLACSDRVLRPLQHPQDGHDWPLTFIRYVNFHVRVRFDTISRDTRALQRREFIELKSVIAFPVTIRQHRAAPLAKIRPRIRSVSGCVNVRIIASEHDKLT